MRPSDMLGIYATSWVRQIVLIYRHHVHLSLLLVGFTMGRARDKMLGFPVKIINFVFAKPFSDRTAGVSSITR